MKNTMAKKRVSRFIAVLVCCCMMLSCVSNGIMAAYSGAQMGTYIDKTYEYEKNGGSKVLSDTEAKTALTEGTDLLMMASGRDVGRTSVTDAEFETYLGYVNVNLRGGNGSYKAADFLRGAIAVGAAGGDPTAVGKDSNGNRVDLLYKGVYSRSITTLEKDGAKTVAYALIALDANGVSDSDIRFGGSKVTREQLKSSLVNYAVTLSGQAVPDVGTAALVLSALAPYYCDGESAVVSAAEDLLYKVSGLQSVDGVIKDSSTATADMIVALCAMNIDPTVNEYFEADLVSGLLRHYNSDGGFAPGGSSAASTSAATSAARCALVAYYCFDQGGFFYDFSSVKAHSVKTITTPTNTGNNSGNSSSSNKNNNSSSSNNGSSSSNKNNNSSSSNKNTGSSSSSSSKNNNSSSSSSKNNGSSSNSAGNNTRSITAEASADKIVEKSVFEDLQGKDEDYVYEGTWGEGEPYTISFNGKNITNPMEFNAEISSIVEHQMEIDAAAGEAEYISFLHEGAFPGKATATITVSVADGSYQCYRYDDAAGKFVEVGTVAVSQGMVSFDLETGGEYFITSSEVSTENVAMAAEDTVDGVVPASVFENIMGKNTELVLSGETERGVRYEITFNGKDIESPMDFNMQITETTAFWDQISKLAEGPLVLHFDHSGAIPGPATVKIFANLESGVNYGLFFYNPSEEVAVYSGAITVGDGEISFGLSHCSDYFIAEFTGETLLDGGSNIWLILLIILGAIIVIGAIAFIVLLRIYGKDGLKEKALALKAKGAEKLGVLKNKVGKDGKKPKKEKKSKKGKKGKKGKEAAEGGDAEAAESDDIEGSEETEDISAEDLVDVDTETEMTEDLSEGSVSEYEDLADEYNEIAEVSTVAETEAPLAEEFVAEEISEEVQRDDSSFMRPDKD